MRFYLIFIYLNTTILFGQAFNPETGTMTFYPKKYISFSLGGGVGDLGHDRRKCIF